MAPVVSRHRAHEELDLYRLSKRVCLDLYALTKSFPKSERLGLVEQIRRSAVSVPVNIAEGAGRRSKKEFERFLLIARSSANELLVLLEIAHETGSLEPTKFAHCQQTLERIFAMTSGLIAHLGSSGTRR